jgi:hypothetical protein
MASLGSPEHTSTATGGYLQGFYLAVATTGAKSIVVTLTGGTVDNILGGSLSFSGVTGHGSLIVKNTDTSPNIAVASNTSGNIIAGALAAGSNITGVSGAATQRTQDNVSTANDTGSMSISTAPATGSSVTLTWTGTSAGSMAAIAVEVQGAPPPPPPAPYALPGRTWVRHFTQPGYHNQVPPGPVMVQANAITATATATANNSAPVTQSAAAAPLFNPGRTWRKRFQFPQQQQLSGPPPLAWAPAGTATATVSAGTPLINPTFISGKAGSGTASYLVDASNRPILLRGDTIWGLPVMAGAAGGAVTYQTDIDAYTSTRAAQGFNAMYIAAISTTNYTNSATNVNGNTWDGVAPFVGGNPGSLNDTYWQRVDYILASAQAQGITVLFNLLPTYADSNAGGPMNGKTNADFTNYGTALGNRYKSRANLVWFLGDDYFDNNNTAYGNAVAAIKATGDTHLFAYENYPESTSRKDMFNSATLTGGTANADFNFVYSYNTGYQGVEDAWKEASPIPVIHGDGIYDTDSVPNLHRNLIWWYLTSGARGVIYGREAIWPWPTTALAALTTNSVDNTLLGTVFNLFASWTGWHLLVPDTNSALVTAGRGTHSSEFTSGGGGGQYASGNVYVSASKSADSSLAVAYLPTTATITVNTALLGAGFTANWVDPFNGTLTAAGAGPNFTAPGTNSGSQSDWVLLFQGPPSTSTLPVQQINPGRTWQRRFNDPGYHNQFPYSASVPVFTNAIAGLASATATASGDDTDAAFTVIVAPNAGASAATGTALGQDTGANIALVSPNATTAAGTGTARGFDTGDMLPGVSYPPQRAQPSPVWLKFFHHEQQPVPPAPFNVYPAPALATVTALGQDNDATFDVQVSPNAAIAPATGTSLGNDTGANEPAVTVNAATATATATAQSASTAVPGPPPAQAYPGAVWRHYFLHPQQFVPPAPVVGATSAIAGLASATGIALGVDTGADIAMVAPNAGVAPATGTSLGQDTGADIAMVSPNAAVAPATGTSLGNDTGANEPAVTVFAQTAAGVASALDASTTIPAPPPAVAAPGRIWRQHFQHPQQFVPPAPVIVTFTNANAGLASATATALGVDTGADIASVAPNAGNAPATGTALGQDQGADVAAVSPNAAVAGGSGAALGPNPQVFVNAGLAAGTGTAQNLAPATASAAAATVAQPGGVWRKHFQHPQQWRPFVPPPPPVFVPATGTATVSDVNTGIATVLDARDGLASVGETGGGAASVG